ncbi:IS21-like element helper ATPase IstB [Cupriavidus sp. IDO]|uniref:IS21-like element helper ATPase IstB n=1 Tax=Cupriavidus sp. IDO TaxID=1539142 RepID=UPI0005795744|nr:IS21-like element helper ATPase IstB [Cupriavidus sp. IDO]KWR82658.1 ATP-binding protein [Cupriavidus sp. IDO]
MNPIPELSSALKQLRLSGVLDTLEVRNREAIERQLAHTDFLALLVHDELARRDQKKLSQRVRRASFRGEKTLEGFDFDRVPNLNRATVYDLATGRYIEEKVCILIAGPCGTGKSHLAQALGHAAVRQGHDVLFTTQTQLLRTLRQAEAVGTYERRFQALARLPVLIIDDFGLKPLRTPDDELLHDLIAERYERASTILTSNLDFSEWGDAFASNKILGAATLDRLRHGAYRVVLDGESYRAPRTMPEQPKSAIEKGGKNRHS